MTIMMDSEIARPQRTRTGAAQKGRSAVWTSEARLQGERHGCLESDGGAV